MDAVMDRVVDGVNAGALGPNVTARRLRRKATDRDEDLRPTDAVNADAEEREQISIGLVDKDRAPAPRRAARAPQSVSDDEDLRPKGPVNTDALRGEVDRASEPVPFRQRPN